MYQLVNPAWFAINKGSQPFRQIKDRSPFGHWTFDSWPISLNPVIAKSRVSILPTWFANGLFTNINPLQHCLFFSVFQWVVEVTLCSSISVVRWRDQIGDRDAHGAVVFVVTNHAFYLIYMSINSQKSCMLAAPNYPLLCSPVCVFVILGHLLSPAVGAGELETAVPVLQIWREEPIV